jgi:signal transduction histidine kinase
MTIKKRLFFSNTGVFLAAVLACGLAALTAWAFVDDFDGEYTPFDIRQHKWDGMDEAEKERFMAVWKRLEEMEASEPGILGTIRLEVAFSMFAGGLVVFSIANIVMAWHLSKSITGPLEPLGEGVRQIHEHNLAYRIAYRNDDEFRPVCEAFNGMAAELEESTARRHKDEASRRTVFAGISHDLLTPLTSIKAYLEGLETGVASTPEMRGKYLAKIKNKTADMEHILGQLFLFSKLDMDELPLAPRRVDISLALSEMIEEVIPDYALRGLAVCLAENPKNIFVSADTIWLRNVVINILENSVRYKSADQGAVNITVSADAAAAELRFTDDGPGVPEEALPKLFDVFYRADPSRSKKGSGLGLAISAKIIGRMGGTIHAELPSSGGLSVVIRLPVSREEAA